jgi:DNA-binding protein HU-beta
MAKDADISKTAAGNALNSFIENITASIKKNNKVTLVGFGTFSLSKRKARKGRNPQTGEEIKIKASKSPKFTPGKAFKDAVN